MMKLLAIDIDQWKNQAFAVHDECRPILDVYPDFYVRAGFHPPWIGYFFQRDNDIVGCGGFKGKPKGGKVEISYGTFTAFQNKGIGTEICRQLVLLSLSTDPQITITARTLPKNSASTTILQKNGFILNGVVVDEEDGDVWEWEYKRDALLTSV